MPKKSFKDNPALQFISEPQNEAETEQFTNEKETASVKVKHEEPVKTAEVKTKINPLYIETKSKRVQLLMQPTLHTQLYRLAKKKKTSFNELVHKALEQYISEN